MMDALVKNSNILNKELNGVGKHTDASSVESVVCSLRTECFYKHFTGKSKENALCLTCTVVYRMECFRPEMECPYLQDGLHE